MFTVTAAVARKVHTCMLMCVHPKREKVRGRDREEENHEIAGFG